MQKEYLRNTNPLWFISLTITVTNFWNISFCYQGLLSIIFVINNFYLKFWPVCLLETVPTNNFATAETNLLIWQIIYETNCVCCNIDIYFSIKLSCKVCNEFMRTFVKKMKYVQYLKLSAFQSVLFSIMTDILWSDLLNIPPKFVCWNVLATISYIFPITFSKNIQLP